MKLRFFPIGAIVTYNKVKLIVTAQEYNRPSCTGCYFSNANFFNYTGKVNTGCYKHGFACTKHCRYDHNHVIFRLLSE